MIKYVFAFFLLFSLCQLSAQELKFESTKQNFGFVKKGEQVKLIYKFTNTGNQPLIITDAKVACSCTKVTWPKEPIPAGKTGVIEVFFDTTPTYDRQDRTVEIISNDAKSPQKVRFKGVVLK